ncbi:FecR domain-containing protein [Fulvivirgaceae bacterium BMA12]|uniref:FecR domain-containing protein n=1 Tax=Agaribacillus aureus TaxID=3051825 RepID=A0ABT8L204_9BACT|nr:FecR domain-containing protein [Fulvivirgaceae bacterium BMA12]
MEDNLNKKTYYEGLLRKFLNYECNESELKIIAALLTGSKYQDILPELLHRASEKFHSDFKMKSVHEEALWQKISAETKVLDQKSRKKNLVLSTVRVAASVILVLGVTFFAYFYFSTKSTPEVYITKVTERGQRLSFTLADGSKVKLNSESTITFPEKFEGSTREVQLSGEAYFEVKKDPNKPFIVSSDNVETKVLGTSFNVNAFPGEQVVVTVSTGKVMVCANSGIPSSGKIFDEPLAREVILTAGQQAIYGITNDQLTTQAVKLEQHIGWNEGILRFDDKPLRDVAQKLERWYDVEILFSHTGFESCRVTSTFKSETIVDVLEELKFIFNLRYIIDKDQKITISGEGCDNH